MCEKIEMRLWVGGWVCVRSKEHQVKETSIVLKRRRTDDQVRPTVVKKIQR